MVSNVVIATVHSEKTRLKKMIMIISIISGMNKLQELTVYETKARKVMVDFKFHALYR